MKEPIRRGSALRPHLCAQPDPPRPGRELEGRSGELRSAPPPHPCRPPQLSDQTQARPEAPGPASAPEPVPARSWWRTPALTPGTPPGPSDSFGLSPQPPLAPDSSSPSQRPFPACPRLCYYLPHTLLFPAVPSPLRALSPPPHLLPSFPAVCTPSRGAPGSTCGLGSASRLASPLAPPLAPPQAPLLPAGYTSALLGGPGAEGPVGHASGRSFLVRADRGGGPGRGPPGL